MPDNHVPVASVLLTRDLAALRVLARPRWQRRALAGPSRRSPSRSSGLRAGGPVAASGRHGVGPDTAASTSPSTSEAAVAPGATAASLMVDQMWSQSAGVFGGSQLTIEVCA